MCCHVDKTVSSTTEVFAVSKINNSKFYVVSINLILKLLYINKQYLMMMMMMMMIITKCFCGMVDN